MTEDMTCKHCGRPCALRDSCCTACRAGKDAAGAESIARLTQEHVDLPESSPIGRGYRTRITALESQNARMKAALEWVRTWTVDDLEKNDIDFNRERLSVVDAALKESP